MSTEWNVIQCFLFWRRFPCVCAGTVRPRNPWPWQQQFCIVQCHRLSLCLCVCVTPITHKNSKKTKKINRKYVALRKCNCRHDFRNCPTGSTQNPLAPKCKQIKHIAKNLIAPKIPIQKYKQNEKSGLSSKPSNADALCLFSHIFRSGNIKNMQSDFAQSI